MGDQGPWASSSAVGWRWLAKIRRMLTAKVVRVESRATSGPK